MPLAGPVLAQQIYANFLSTGFTGPQALNFAMAIGNGTINSILATNIYTGTTVGIGPGPGTSTGKLVGLVGPLVGQNIFQMMTAQGFTGPQALNTALAIGNAFADHILAFGIVNAIGGPVAVGNGTGPLTGIVGAVLAQSILLNFTTVGFTGPQSINTANAIGNGIAMTIPMAIVNTVIVGVPAPPPAGAIPLGGVETGRLL